MYDLYVYHKGVIYLWWIELALVQTNWIFSHSRDLSNSCWHTYMLHLNVYKWFATYWIIIVKYSPKHQIKIKPNLNKSL